MDLSELKFFIGQINPTVGDISGNTEQIISGIEQAKKAEADILIFPELAISGYFPRDLLYYQSFHDQIAKGIQQIAKQVTDFYVIVGAPIMDKNHRLRNVALIFHNKKVVDQVNKTLLPNYDVFEERRYFLPGRPKVVEMFGIKFGVQICEDAWDHLWMHNTRVTHKLKGLGAECMINISASPFTFDKQRDRFDLIKRHVSENDVPFIYVNCAGGQDEIVFDGKSFAFNRFGEAVFAADAFKTGNYELDGALLVAKDVEETSYYTHSKEERIVEAITMNLRDYLDKNNLSTKLLVALSGGVDSALTLVMATMTVGPDNVTPVYMPTKFSAVQSYHDAKQLCDNLDLELMIIEIEDLRTNFMDVFSSIPTIDPKWGIADENIQARIRASIIMYLSNKTGAIVVSTGNKSEIATGYCTLYGDTSGGKNLIGDLYKTEVYEVCQHLNKEMEIIPNSILTRAPTAELKADQKDSDSLPEYDILDKILYQIIEEKKSAHEIIEMGYQKVVVEKVFRLVKASEFKRDQLVQTVKVSERMFGLGWNYPIAADYKL